ncbi:MAG: hypothetical protein ACOY3K_03215 [Candidatus Omnitrophota bacterium]
MRAELLDWLVELRRTCNEQKIPIEDICIVGSSPLEVLGVRNSTDIDITIKQKLRTDKYGNGITHLSNNIDIVTEGYHRSHLNPHIKDDRLITDPEKHFIFRGFKFANTEIVLERKAFSRREKDEKDIIENKKFIAAEINSKFDAALQYSILIEEYMRLSETSKIVASANKEDSLAALVWRKTRLLIKRLKHQLAQIWRKLNKKLKN